MRTLIDAFDRAAAITDRGYLISDGEGSETFTSYAEILENARRRGGALRAAGLRPGDRVAIVLVDVADFITTFFGAIMAGAVPVPMFPPFSLARLDAYLDGCANVLRVAGASLLITERRLALLLWELVERLPSLSKVVALETLRRADAEVPGVPVAAAPDDLALLQFTSGSTALPRGVRVSHRMVVQNVLATAVDVDRARPDRDVGVSWLPLFHDMGMSFATVGLITTCQVVFIPTLSFVRKPNLWLDAIHRHRGTVTYAPNFAFGLAGRRARERDLERWDLSCVRVMGCGAEPIQADTLRSFQELFGKHCGLPAEAFQPCYGLAEATLAVTMVPTEEKFRVDRVDARRFESEGVAAPLAAPAAPALEFVACGPPIAGHEVVLRDADGAPVGERVKGLITVRGPCVTPGYFRDDAATAEILRDGWLQTGDLGYLAGGQLFVTGRQKELIILRGRNQHPHPIEWTAAMVPGIRAGSVIAFSRPGEHGEELVIAAETREQGPERLVELRRQVARRVRDELALATAEVVLVAVGSLPKTSSGKVQRLSARRQYLDGTLGRLGDRRAGAGGGRLDLVRHLLRSLRTRLRAAFARHTTQPR